MFTVNRKITCCPEMFFMLYQKYAGKRYFQNQGFQIYGQMLCLSVNLYLRGIFSVRTGLLSGISHINQGHAFGYMQLVCGSPGGAYRFFPGPGIFLRLHQKGLLQGQDYPEHNSHVHSSPDSVLFPLHHFLCLRISLEHRAAITYITPASTMVTAPFGRLKL